jgi:hypothetical protein
MAAPSVAMTTSASAYVFWEGTDGNLWESYGSGSGNLSSPLGLGDGWMGSGPTAAVDNNGYTYVYWKGELDGNLWEAFWNGSAWITANRGFTPLG